MMIDDIIMDVFINKADNEGKFGIDFLIFKNKSRQYIFIKRLTSRLFMKNKIKIQRTYYVHIITLRNKRKEII